MKTGKRLHIATAAMAMLLPTAVVAEDLGVMRVDSTTIDNRFEAKKGEPSNVVSIDGKTIENAHAESVKQILDAIPGITAELQSQDSLKIHIRGVENQRFMGEKPGVAVVIDGVPVFERTGRVNINMDDIESIKVIKGGASYLFGEDALAGAVIITTKRGAKMAGAQASAEMGSFGYKRGLARLGFANDKASGHVQVSRRDANGYYYQGNYKADYLNGKLQGYLSDSSDLTFGWELANRFKDSHGTVTGVTQAALDPTSIAGRDYARHYDVNLGKFYLTYANDLSETTNLMVNLYQFNDHTRFWTAPVRFDAARQPVTNVDAYSNNNDYKQVQRGLKSELRGGSESFAWLSAIDLRDNSYKNRVDVLQDYRASAFSPVVTAGTLVSDNNTRERMGAAYGELKFRVAKGLTATMNGRYDYIKLGYDDYLPAAAAPHLSKSFNVGSWRGGLNYDLTDSVALYANASTGFRAPTINQLFAGTINLNGAVAANPNLKPEQAYNYELGLRGKLELFDDLDWAGLEWDLAAFQIDRKDFILNVAGQYATPAAGVTDQYQNIGGMRNRGVELSLKSDKQQLLSFDLAYTYLLAKFTKYDNFNLLLGPRGAQTVMTYNNSGKVVPRTSKHKLFLAAHLAPVQGMTLTSEMNAQSAYFADEINQVMIGGHTVFNAVANYDFAMGASDQVKWSLFARVDNALDRTYYNTARGTSDSNGDMIYNAEDISIVVNQGRTLTAGITATF